MKPSIEQGEYTDKKIVTERMRIGSDISAAGTPEVLDTSNPEARDGPRGKKNPPTPLMGAGEIKRFGILFSYRKSIIDIFVILCITTWDFMPCTQRTIRMILLDHLVFSPGGGKIGLRFDTNISNACLNTDISCVAPFNFPMVLSRRSSARVSLRLMSLS